MNIERLKQAIAIIEAIPDEKVNLRTWQRQKNIYDATVTKMEDVSCGTLACAAGWLVLHPDMQAQGLKVGLSGNPVYNNGRRQLINFYALATFFDIRDVEADSLFQSRNSSEMRGGNEDLTDKQIWLQRANRLLEQA